MLVDALRHHAGRPDREHAAEAAVRAGVADDPAAQPGDGAVAPQPDLDVLHLAATVRHRDHVLGAGLDPLAPADRARARPRTATMPSGDPVLRAERAADVRRDDPHLLGLEAEHRWRRIAADHVRHLARRGTRVSSWPSPSSPGTHRDRGALHRHDGEALVLEAAAHDDVGVGERVVAVGLAARRSSTFEPTLVELHRRVGRERRLHVGDRGQRVVVDDRPPRRRRPPAALRLGDHHRDGVADEAHPVAARARAHHRGVQLHQPGVVGEVEVGGACTRATTPGIAPRLARVDRR